MCGYNLKLVDVPRATLTTSPENGAYIWGLFMEGARCAIEILYLLLLLLHFLGGGVFFWVFHWPTVVATLLCALQRAFGGESSFWGTSIVCLL